MIYYHSYRFNGGLIECEFDYEPEERGAREDGIQLEPDCPPVLTLIAAYLNRIDILELLSGDAIEEIEHDALKSI